MVGRRQVAVEFVSVSDDEQPEQRIVMSRVRRLVLCLKVVKRSKAQFLDDDRVFLRAIEERKINRKVLKRGGGERGNFINIIVCLIDISTNISLNSKFAT